MISSTGTLYRRCTLLCYVLFDEMLPSLTSARLDDERQVETFVMNSVIRNETDVDVPSVAVTFGSFASQPLGILLIPGAVSATSSTHT